MLPEFHWDASVSDGDMPTNNWKENPDGQTYIQRAGAEGRSDVLEWATDFLGPRFQKVFEDFSARYGWGDPGQVPGAQEKVAPNRSRAASEERSSFKKSDPSAPTPTSAGIKRDLAPTLSRLTIPHAVHTIEQASIESGL